MTSEPVHSGQHNFILAYKNQLQRSALKNTTKNEPEFKKTKAHFFQTEK